MYCSNSVEIQLAGYSVQGAKAEARALGCSWWWIALGMLAGCDPEIESGCNGALRLGFGSAGKFPTKREWPEPVLIPDCGIPGRGWSQCVLTSLPYTSDVFQPPLLSLAVAELEVAWWHIQKKDCNHPVLSLLCSSWFGVKFAPGGQMRSSLLPSESSTVLFFFTPTHPAQILLHAPSKLKS